MPGGHEKVKTGGERGSEGGVRKREDQKNKKQAKFAVSLLAPSFILIQKRLASDRNRENVVDWSGGV